MHVRLAVGREEGLANANAIEGAWNHDISANNACVAFQLSCPPTPPSLSHLALKIANKQNKTVINRKVVSEAAYEIIRSRPSEIQ